MSNFAIFTCASLLRLAVEHVRIACAAVAAPSEPSRPLPVVAAGAAESCATGALTDGSASAGNRATPPLIREFWTYVVLLKVDDLLRAPAMLEDVAQWTHQRTLEPTRGRLADGSHCWGRQLRHSACHCTLLAGQRRPPRPPAVSGRRGAAGEQEAPPGGWGGSATGLRIFEPHEQQNFKGIGRCRPDVRACVWCGMWLNQGRSFCCSTSVFSFWPPRTSYDYACGRGRRRALWVSQRKVL
eukprot:GHVT01052746.1.p1 GENE.GHVT01052746.1~~GHVT01052746.1.p1  ORF type:complete len:241 (-),score=50.08 GHVT01052746.1:464-1186(-)